MELGEVFHAVMVLEDLIYFHPEFEKRVNYGTISRMMSEIENYLSQNPDVARGYYYKAFLLYLRGDYKKAVSTFLVAQGLGLNAKYMKRKLKYMKVCHKNLREHEEFLAKYRAGQIIQKKVKDANILKRIDDSENINVAERSDLDEEEIQYRCALNRDLIDRAVENYNQDNIEEMDEENFSLKRLYNFGYLKKIPVCPEGGKYSLLSGGISQCSIHGK